MAAVIIPPIRKLIFPGARFEMSLAGLTTLAAMFVVSVAQNPTIAVSCGPNARQNSALVLNALPCPNSTDTSPTFTIAHTISANPATIKNGAAQLSSHLIELIPCHTKCRFTSQNARKHANCHPVIPSPRSEEHTSELQSPYVIS